MVDEAVSLTITVFFTVIHNHTGLKSAAQKDKKECMRALERPFEDFF